MPKVTLDRNAFKALASDTRLDILRVLDGKKMTLRDISNATNLNKATLHEHLSKLHEVGLVKRNEREGHKWVYYKLSWKGESLLHPENTRVVVLFSATFITLFFGIMGLINVAGKMVTTPSTDMLMRESESLAFTQDPASLYMTTGCLILFIILLSISLWRSRENKAPKL